DLSVDRLAAYAPEVFAGLTPEERSVLESRVRYEGYIRRERESVERLKPLQSRPIPENFQYEGIPGLSREVVEKCARRRPLTVGEASRIPGVTPAAVAIISAHVARGRAASA
ncbi:MAG: tRNA uridine-5-carboxymethylaminomethyl(34) synthesis enzyme MnmG, partial [Thermoanaerobaculia bacterium]